MSTYRHHGLSPLENDPILLAHRMRAETVAMFFRFVASKVKAAAAPLLRWRERQRIIAELSVLTDTELADLGITRSDIGSVAAGQYVDERARPARRLPQNNNDRRRLAA